MQKSNSCKRKIEWSSHIAMSKELSFRPHEKELVMKCFEADLDHEIEKAKKSHWIHIKCFWKNCGSKDKNK